MAAVIDRHGAARIGESIPPAPAGAGGAGAPSAGLARLLRRLRGSGPAAGYWLTRFLVLRLLGLVYFFAFLSLALQVRPLIGRDGLLPARLYLPRLVAHFGSRFEAFLQEPSLFLWTGVGDGTLAAFAWTGVALSGCILLGFANAIVLVLLWAIYMSFVNVGQDWFRYGWDIQIQETGFLAIFLCPLFDPRPFPRRPPPRAVIVLLRWLAFRIMLGAGLIKIRGDACWRDLTCLDHHYETQPIPNPLSRWFHFQPHGFQAAGVLFNHVTELVAPWFAFGRRRARHLAGGLMVLFQVILILSGNLSFLNYLTLVPVLACFDDALLGRILPPRLRAAADRAAGRAEGSRGQRAAVAVLCALVAVLSIEPVLNLLSPRQRMNSSFTRLNLVNTYGAFGSVGEVRREIIFEGTDEAAVSETTRWREYGFRCKPGDPLRRPCVVAPYQPRLDWQIWFAAMSAPQRYPWTVHLVWKLLHNDPVVLGLLDRNPFPDTPPRFVRARHDRYAFAPPGAPDGAWWRRETIGLWLPPLAADDPRLLRFLSAHGWLQAPADPGPR